MLSIFCLSGARTLRDPKPKLLLRHGVRVSFGQRRDEERREGKKEQKKRNGMLYYAVWWEGKIV
jgi:hypothetical protein